MSTEIVEQLEAQVVAMQFLLCSKLKQMQDYFKRAEVNVHPSNLWQMSQEIFLLWIHKIWMTWNLSQLIQLLLQLLLLPL